MALGGFKRALKLDADGRVIDHRPPGHEDTKDDGATWLVVDVPKDVPASLNQLITAGVLHAQSGKVVWPAKVEIKEPTAAWQPGGEPTKQEILLKILEMRASAEEMAKARRALLEERQKRKDHQSRRGSAALWAVVLAALLALSTIQVCLAGDSSIVTQDDNGRAALRIILASGDNPTSKGSIYTYDDNGNLAQRMVLASGSSIAGLK